MVEVLGTAEEVPGVEDARVLVLQILGIHCDAQGAHLHQRPLDLLFVLAH